MPLRETIVVLGGGWVGGAWARALAGRGEDVVVTHRGEASAAHAWPDAGALAGRVRTAVFRLDDASTWDAVPRGAARYLWTFPAGAGAEAFHAAVVEGAPCCVLSSTSCYGHADADAPVDEDAPVDLAQPRFAAEEALRARGAAVLALAGLFGHGRSPASWLARGLVRDTTGTVNLVHRDDVLAALDAWRADPAPARGRRLNACTQTHRWSELILAYVAAGLLPSGFPVPPARSTGRVVSGERLRALYPAYGARTPRDARDGAALA